MSTCGKACIKSTRSAIHFKPSSKPQAMQVATYSPTHCRITTAALISYLKFIDLGNFARR